MVRLMRALSFVFAFALPVLCQTPSAAPAPGPAQQQQDAASPSSQATESNLKRLIAAAQEAHQNQEMELEITNWRTAFMVAVTLRNVEATYISSLGLEQVFKENSRPLERVAALRSGVNELKKQGGAGPIWGAQMEVALAIALEEQGKRGDAATAARRAVAVLENALGPKSHDFRETLRTLTTLFEEGGNVVAAEFARRLEEIERSRDAEPVFGYKPDSPLRGYIDLLRAAVDSSSAVQVQLNLGQINNAAEKLDPKNPFRAKALSEAAGMVLNSAFGKKTDPVSRIQPVAEGMLRKAVELRERAMGSTLVQDTSKLTLELYHLREYQREVDLLSRFYAAAGETQKQEELLVRALASSEKLLGQAHPALAGPLRRLGDFYYGSGNKDRVKQVGADAAAAAAAARQDNGAGLDKALTLVRRELAIYEYAFGKEAPILQSSVSRLSELLWLKGQEAEAKQCDERVAKLTEAEQAARSAEESMLLEVKQHRAFLRFEEAEDQYETFRKLHPDKSS